jgi:hypothetical protein
LICQGTTNQSNPRLYRNGVIKVVGTQTQANNSGGMNIFYNFNSGDTI